MPPLLTLSPITVTPCPAPCRVIPALIVTVLVQFVWEQAGSVTVSPGVAALMAVCTSLALHEAALIVCARAAGAIKTTQEQRKNKVLCNPRHLPGSSTIVTRPRVGALSSQR